MAFLLSIVFGSLIGLAFVTTFVRFSLFSYEMFHGFINFSMQMQRL